MASPHSAKPPLGPGVLEATEHGHQVVAKHVGNVAAFLDNYGRRSGFTQASADAAKPVGRDSQERQRIMFRGIQT